MGLVPVRQPASRAGLGVGGQSSCQLKSSGGEAEGSAAPGRAPEMVVGAAGWWCLVLWLPACVAAHGERQRAGLCCGAGHPACARLGLGAPGHLGDPASSGGWSGWVLVLRNLNWARPEPHLPTSKQDSPSPQLTPTQAAEGAIKRRNKGPLEILMLLLCEHIW